MLKFQYTSAPLISIQQFSFLHCQVLKFALIFQGKSVLFHSKLYMLNSSRISLTPITSFAPSFISMFVPSLLMRSTLPGTAKTSRPCSRAQLAVINEPLPAAASTTTTLKTIRLLSCSLLES